MLRLLPLVMWLSACAAVAVPGAVAVPEHVRGGPTGYGYSCPPADRTEEYIEGVCVGSLRPDDGRLRWSALALAQPEGLTAVAVSGAPLARIYMSENGGADWRAAGLARDLLPVSGLGETTSTGRVALEFDNEGRLHLVAELIRTTDSTATRSARESIDLYHLSSPDFGRSWTRPVMLPTNGWGVFPTLVAAGNRLFVTWGYRGDYRLNLASSADGGNSWALAKAAPDDCINSSEVALLRGIAYVACAGYTLQDEAAAIGEGRNPFIGLRLYRLDPSGRLNLVSTLDSFEGVWPRLFAASDGSLVLLAKLYRVHSTDRGWDKCCAAVARSADAGRTWSGGADLRTMLRSEDGWDTFDLAAARLDSWGLLHIIASGSDQADPANGSPGTDARLVHAIFDPASGRLLGEASLTPPTSGPGGYYPGDASLAFHSTLGIASWSSGDRLDYTRLTPQGTR